MRDQLFVGIFLDRLPISTTGIVHNFVVYGRNLSKNEYYVNQKK